MFINWKLREINLKIVYYGAALSGKTTNLEYIHAKMDPRLMAKPSPAIKICIEVDDKGTHGYNADSYKFSDDRFRQNDLVIDDWKVLRFSLHSILEQPRRCQQ